MLQVIKKQRKSWGLKPKQMNLDVQVLSSNSLILFLVFKIFFRLVEPEKKITSFLLLYVHLLILFSVWHLSTCTALNALNYGYMVTENDQIRLPIVQFKSVTNKLCTIPASDCSASAVSQLLFLAEQWIKNLFGFCCKIIIQDHDESQQG